MVDLTKLAEPFPPGDIKWRVLRADMDQNDKPYAMVFAYISKRALQQRLDDVVGPENWCNVPMTVAEVMPGVYAVQCGISINIDGHWVTKYDVASCSEIEPAKGGFSGASKRAGSQWGVGRYLEHIGQQYVELVKTKRDKDSIYLRLKANQTNYYWNPPKLPGWALPKVKSEIEKEEEKPVTEKARNSLYFAWKAKMAPLEKDKAVLRTAFDAWVFAIVGEFPIGDLSCWTHQMLDDCRKRLEMTTSGGGPSADVPFT